MCKIENNINCFILQNVFQPACLITPKYLEIQKGMIQKGIIFWSQELKIRLKDLRKQIRAWIFGETIGSNQYNKTRQRKVRQKNQKGKDKAVLHCVNTMDTIYILMLF